METFYTVDIDQGNSLALYEICELSSFEGTRPVYVSSLAYGRLAYLTLETTETLSSIQNNLNILVDYLAGDTSVDINTAKSKLKTNTNLNITVIGSETPVTTLDGFLSMIANQGFSTSNPGKIIAYKLRFVDNNKVASIVYNDEYTVRKTVANQGKGIEVRLRLSKLQSDVEDGAGTNAEFYGQLVWDYGGSSNFDLWHYSSKAHFVCAEVGITLLNPPYGKHVFLSKNDSFSIVPSGFTEDDSSGDDAFINKPKNLSVNNLLETNTHSITLQMVKETSQYVKFTIDSRVKVLY